jgi:hypothetical protein
MIESDLKAYLAADAAILALVGSRIYPLKLPQAPTLPALTYQKISGSRVTSLSGYSGLSHPRMQIDCWASTYEQVKDVAAAVVTALDAYPGSIMNDDGRDNYQPDVELPRVTIDFTIWHH